MWSLVPWGLHTGWVRQIFFFKEAANKVIANVRSKEAEMGTHEKGREPPSFQLGLLGRATLKKWHACHGLKDEKMLTVQREEPAYTKVLG